ncbi:hypothetical protein JHK85_053230 [Glycine max]|uniref:two-component response regulator ARR2 n=1 Tax=Glycine max TaxID=3847 RepID=UPI000294EB25|nr:two-component response regulator ARR2 [Glycine max]KAG4914893.1 hypothetical protein JHK87_052450 [Glycine soja]KAG4926744.1 hypothetical protein JHK85_053230 [Glycine max]|eukprot:XP_014627050.1 two-component response regulator ARR2 [Glycine max]
MATYPTKEKVNFHPFPEGLTVLAVDDDHNVLVFIKRMCIQWNYRVIAFSDAPSALNFVREKKGCNIDVILTEVHMANMDGYEFLKHATKEINVPIIMMSHDNATTTSALMEAVKHGACDFWIKPLNENQFRILWTQVARKMWNEKMLAKTDDSSVHGTRVMNTEKNSSTPPKKPRLVWQGELQQRFVRAIMHLGLDKAQPKRILEVMNVPGLTKEHVASHLQKYRVNLKKSNKMITAHQENEMQMQLPNNIESRGMVGASSIFPYAVLHPEEQWPNYYHLEEQQGVPYIAKYPSNMINNAKNFAQPIMTVDDAPICGVLPQSNTVTANNALMHPDMYVAAAASSEAANSDALSNSFNELSAILHGNYNF